jgi:hypothetical protein
MNHLHSVMQSDQKVIPKTVYKQLQDISDKCASLTFLIPERFSLMKPNEIDGTEQYQGKTSTGLQLCKT